ncbi:hypothetical protein KI387_012280 [Taxus chinensis]|uniref:Uncharacterized protein n=1 Tax=Taxus chinensis TaxID=29808 RepID=A0AA38CNK8_TAXCH|nr:hypothetical protein KI387_012280 [Taxus chinensis]
MAKAGSAVFAANPNSNNADPTTESLSIPKKPNSGMEKLEALYENIPEDFQEELTLSNIAGSFKFKESTTRPKRKEEIDLDAINAKLVKNMARQNSNNTDSSVSSIDFGKGLQAVKPSSSQREKIQNPATTGVLQCPSDGSDNSTRYILKGSNIRDPLAYSDPDDNISMHSDASSNLAGSQRKSSMFSTDLDVSYTSAPSVRGSKARMPKPTEADQDKSSQKRQGTPHTNICSICDKSVYLGKYRCLVCGRAYCKACVAQGMGDMPEGRKCTACVGHRFSQRYIAQAGKIGCCVSLPSSVKQAELKWAELGARKPRNRSTTPNVSPRGSRKSARVSPTRPNRAT